MSKNNKTNLVGIDKWIIDLSFLKNYWHDALNIIRKNTETPLFFQTRLLLDKDWNLKSRYNKELIDFLSKNFDDYISSNIFLYDEHVLKKLKLRNYNENGEFKYSDVIHPILFIINLAILLYFYSNRRYEDDKRVYCRYDFSYNYEELKFFKNNLKSFEILKNDLIKNRKSYIKLNIKNFYSSITEDVLRKYINKKFNLNNNILEVIINYTKHICSDGSKVIPTHEFSPLYSYLATSCVLEGILKDVYNESAEPLNVNFICFIDDIYIFSDSINNAIKYKEILADRLFDNNLEINELKTSSSVDTNSSNNYQDIIISNFLDILISEVKSKDNYLKPLDVFKELTKKYNINPFHCLLNFEYNVEKNDIECTEIYKTFSEDKFDHLLSVVKEINIEDYLKVIDINPKYFILLFSLLDNEYSKGRRGTINTYLLSKLVEKFSNYKNSDNEIINDDYYIYYYLNQSFTGLYKYSIPEYSFHSINNGKRYINFQAFVKNLYDEFPNFDKHKNLFLGLNNLPIKNILSLLFFLENQFNEKKYNDCILIISALYDLIKDCAKDSNLQKYLVIKNLDSKCLHCNKSFNDFLNSKSIDKISINEWDNIYKIRCNLSSCHFNSGTQNNTNVEQRSISDVERLIKSVKDWIFNKRSNSYFNNYLNFLLILEELKKK